MMLEENGTVVVNYSYDTWGNIVSITGSLKDSVGVKNPYRYRGYRYDEETGMYYLQSRYYNAEWGRFINADGIVGIKGELLSHNIFMYCNNNAINMCDKSGRFPAIIPFLPAIGKVLGAAILTLGATLVGGLIGNKINYIQRDKAVNKVVTKEADKTKKNKKTVDLYRTMNINEYNKLEKTKKLSVAKGTMEMKWFATNKIDAKRWQNKFVEDDQAAGRYIGFMKQKIVKITVPQDALAGMLYKRDLDSIAPAYCAHYQYINAVMISWEVVE